MAYIGPETVKKMKGVEVAPQDLRFGQDLIICENKTCYLGTFKHVRYAWRGRGWHEKMYIVISLWYDEPDIGSSLQDYYIKEFEAPIGLEGDNIVIDYLPFRIFRVAYGSSIATVAHAKGLSPDTAKTIAEMLTGERPRGLLPARIPKKDIEAMEEKSNLPSDTSQMHKALGGRTRKAKGKKYRKRAGRLSTRRVRSSSR